MAPEKERAEEGEEEDEKMGRKMRVGPKGGQLIHGVCHAYLRMFI